MTFSDGGRAIGSFVYDSDTNTYSAIKVSTTPGRGITAGTANTAGKDHTQVSTAAGNSSNTKANFQEASPTLKNVTGYLTMQTTTPLTNVGGTVSVTAVSSENIFTDNSGSISVPLRTVTGGNLVAANPVGPQTWYLSGVTFDDGAQAIGSFAYDASSGTFSQINIQTTTGSTFGPVGYTNIFVAASTAKNLAILTTSTPVAAGRVLNLALVAALTNAPGSITIALTTGVSAEGTCNSATCQSGGSIAFLGAIRNVVSGSVTTTLPAGYNKVLSQIADGGGWQTSLLLTNLTDAPVPFTVSFFDDTGLPKNIPAIGTTLTGVVPARRALNLTSANTATVTAQAWARVINAQGLTVTALLTFEERQSRRGPNRHGVRGSAGGEFHSGGLRQFGRSVERAGPVEPGPDAEHPD